MSQIELIKGKLDCVGFYFIVGYPGEEKEDLANIAKFIVDMVDSFAYIYVNITPFIPQPATLDWHLHPSHPNKIAQEYEFLKGEIGQYCTDKEVMLKFLDVNAYLFENLMYNFTLTENNDLPKLYLFLRDVGEKGLNILDDFCTLEKLAKTYDLSTENFPIDWR